MSLLLCWALSLAAAPSVAAPLPLDPIRTEFVRQVLASEPALSGIWPGFSMPKNGLLLHFKGAGSLLVGAGAAPRGFRELAPEDRRRLGAPESLNLSFDAGVPPPIATTFSPDQAVAGMRVFVLVFDDRMAVDDQVLLLHHEAFHKFQWDAFTSGGAAAKEERPDSPESSAMRRIENRLLLLALTDPVGWTKLTRDFIAVRRRRYDRSVPSVRAAEDVFERREGVAEYVGQRAALPPGIDAASAGFVLAPKLAVSAFEMGAAGTAALYASGAAQAILLDRLNAPWKARVAAGASVFELLQEAFPEPGNADPVLEEFGWQALAEQELRAADSRQAAAAQAEPAETPKGPRLVIRVWDAKVDGLNTSGGSPRTTPEGLLYPSLLAAELTGIKDFRATYRNTSLIHRSGKDARRVSPNATIFPTEFVSFLDDGEVAVELDGKRLKAVPNSAAFHKLTLRAARAELTSSRPGRINSDTSGITIELDAR